jgi:hypothetical protein
MKFVFTLILAVNCFLAVSAQQHQSAIKQAAMEMGNALVKKDGERFLSYMHPSMIRLAGGKTQLRVMADSAFKVVEQVGGRVSRISRWRHGDGQRIAVQQNDFWASTAATVPSKGEYGGP